MHSESFIYPTLPVDEFMDTRHHDMETKLLEPFQTFSKFHTTMLQPVVEFCIYPYALEAPAQYVMPRNSMLQQQRQVRNFQRWSYTYLYFQCAWTGRIARHNRWAQPCLSTHMESWLVHRRTEHGTPSHAGFTNTWAHAGRPFLRSALLVEWHT